MEENENGGYTAEGRKLRPRRPRIYESSPSGESKPYISSEESRPYGPHSDSRSYGERSEGKSYGERRDSRPSYGDRNGRFNSDRRNSYGSRGGSYGHGERRSYGGSREEGRPYGSRSDSRSYGERSEGKSYGERRDSRPSYGDRDGRFNSDRRNSYGFRSGSYGHGERRSYGGPREEGRPYGPRSDSRSYGERSEGKSYGERRDSRPSYGDRDGRFNSDRRNSYGSRSGSYGHGEGRSYGSPRGGRGEFKPKYSYSGRYRGGQDTPRESKPFYSFDEKSDSGIAKMLSRKSVIGDGQNTELNSVQTQVEEEVRLNKFIANSGVCSRREADQFIQAGVVTVNDEVVTELGTKINALKDVVKFNGERLQGEAKVYIVMNKPKGFVTTSSDPHADRTVMDLLKGCSSRVFPVGRLDKNTTGVLLFTNDGDIAEKLTHPSYDKKKIYQVILSNPLTDEDREKILSGITLGDGDIKADELEYIDETDHRKLGIEIHSGKNRIVRRIFESLGYDVMALDRVYFAGLTKKGLKKGDWRYLSEGEANLLKMGAYV